jgi:hypothetical protein
MIKKIYRFFNGPLIRFQFKEYLKKYSLYQDYLLEYKEYGNTLFEFKDKNSMYQKIDLTLNHKKYLSEINPDLHLKIVKKLKLSQNPYYFHNLHSYGISGIFFDKTYGSSIKEKYFLLPPNIVFLEIISRVNFKKKSNYYVVDLPSGLGNFLGYLNNYIPKENLIGVDNFSQISRENISRYQRQTFGFNIVSNSELNNKKIHFIWFVGGLPISYIIEEIKKFKPQYLFIDISYYLEETDLLNDSYDIDFFNEVVIILKKKNESSIQEFFKK